MTFLEALRRDKFVRRAGWPSWRCFSERGMTGGRVTRTDLLADDWEPNERARPTDPGETNRFMLMELE